MAVFLLYWPLARFRAGALGVILFANYFFYARWDLYYLILIPVASTLDYALGRAIGSTKAKRARKSLLAVSVLMNIGLLVFFKYAGFLRDNWATWTGAPAPERWGWVLPISISFYVFQALTYTIDIYRRDAKPSKSYLAHLAAVSFFPTTLSGPITRVSTLIDQMEARKPLAANDAGRALFLIATGLMKKLLIADYLATNFINRVFDFPNLYTGGEVLTAVYGYAFQLYFDFSGYSDIAIGSALLLGIKLPINFNAPYAAENIADFWRRWHISLSNWLRDYLYFSLGGSRSKWRPYLNLFLTMVIGGLWHGASWTFVVWGALHGFGLVVVRLWQNWMGTAKATGFWRIVNIVLTFHFVTFAWIFFRAANLETAWEIISRIQSVTPNFENVSGPLWVILAIAVVAHYMPRKLYEASQTVFSRAPFYAQAAALLILVASLQYVVTTGAAPFIYTNF